MVKLRELISEAQSKDTLTDSILRELEPLIEKIIIKHEESFPDYNHGREMTEFDKEMVRLTLIYDMLRSIEIYTKPTDELKYINARLSAKSSLDIRAIVEREGVRYSFDTEAIYAGGHNIQVLHFRYLTKTKLPKTGNQLQAAQVKSKMQKLSKAEKWNIEIAGYVSMIKKSKDDIAFGSKFNDAQIKDWLMHNKLNGIDYSRTLTTTWETIPDDSHAKQNNTKETFDLEHGKYIQSIVDNFKHRFITRPQEYIKMYEVGIKKLQSKINALI